MTTYFQIELRYAILNNLLMLFWLLVEYLIGLQDKYIALNSYASLIMLLVIFYFCFSRSFDERIEERYGKLTFRQALVSGLMLTLFTCLLAPGVQYIFHKFINPDFISSMINYMVSVQKTRPETAAMYINLNAILVESFVSAVVAGLIFSLFFAWRRYTIQVQK